jgi:hypothetical protein
MPVFIGRLAPDVMFIWQLEADPILSRLKRELSPTVFLRCHANGQPLPQPPMGGYFAAKQ